MTQSQFRREFEATFAKEFGLAMNDDPVALWAARYALEKAAQEAESQIVNAPDELNKYADGVARGLAHRLRNLIKELEEK